MIVVGIMGIILTMSVPLVYRVWHRAPMAQALHDVTEVCSSARREAILHGHQVDLVFHGDGRFEVAGGIGGSSTPSPDSPVPAPLTPARSGYSGRLPENIGVVSIKIDGRQFRDADLGRVRFFPNGTCDELKIVLLQPDNGDSRGIFLEVTTGLVDIISDRSLLSAEVR
jgi:hypothetical protein